MQLSAVAQQLGSTHETPVRTQELLSPNAKLLHSEHELHDTAAELKAAALDIASQQQLLSTMLRSVSEGVVIGPGQFQRPPRNEKVLLKRGSAFDVAGARRQLDFRVDTARKTMTEEIEVRPRSQKRERVEVGQGEPVSLGQPDHKLDVARLPQGRRAHDRLSGQHSRGCGSRDALHSAVQLVGGLFPLAVRAWRAPTSEALTAKSSSAPRVEQAIDFARLCESV
jgi:hypothetical protein